MSDFNEIEFDDSVVDENLLYDEGRKSYPSIIWHGRHGADAVGSWTLDREASELEPSLYWEANEVRFGGSPNAPLTPVWQVKRLRVLILGQRRRQIIVDNAGVEHYFPYWTKRTERNVDGDFKSHTQVAVVLPGSMDIYQIPLKGFSKSVMWSNPPGSYHIDKFGPGAWVQYREYVDKARAQTKKNFPYYGTFFVDLVPVMAKEKKELGFVDVGNGVYMACFQADLSTHPEGKNNLPISRWVGQDMFQQYQDLRRDVIKPWEDEWNLADNMPSEQPQQNGGYNYSSDVEEDDDIPF